MKIKGSEAKEVTKISKKFKLTIITPTGNAAVM
jgi:hypothetical protein